ncbi:hypothetical protein [Hwanghaeella sp.]|uniref:hypothetical protein n=1 Tax=Hwanghaeella sp. TaxID=2605943 RepID=UPI003CCC3675
MPNAFEQPVSNDIGIKTYWLQALQAGHWRNVEHIAEAAEAMIRTGAMAQGSGFDAVRLLEARFQARQGRTEFHEIVTIGVAGARFAGPEGLRGPDHVRMDLVGTIAPLLPSDATEIGDMDAVAGADTPVATPHTVAQPDTAEPAWGDLGAADFVRMRHEARPPTRRQDAAPRRDRTRARLMAGVMVGAFAVGVAVSAMAPEQSGKIAAAIYERIGAGSGANPTALASAPEIVETPTIVQDAAPGNNEWPVASGRTRAEATADTPAIAPAPIAPTPVAASPTDTALRMETPAVVAAPSGKDLEAEHDQPAANRLAAVLAKPNSPAREDAGRRLTDPATPATTDTAAPPMTEQEAYIMQASLPMPAEVFTQPGIAPAPATEVQLAESSAEEGLQLAVTDIAETAVPAAFTAAVAGDASQLGKAAAFPRPQRKPAALKERAARHAALADAIENGTVADLRALITNPSGSVEVASLSNGSIDSGTAGAGIDLTSLLDFALLQGRPAHAEALAAEGARPSDGILNALKRSADAATLKRIAPIVRKVGIDPDRVSDTGMTPLMQAAYIGDGRGVEALLALGADPAFETGEGLRAADFASRAKHVDVQEKLVLAADQALYAPLMFGLSWSDTLETVKSRSDVCKQVGEGFVACSLKAESWLDDTAAVIAQFDSRNGNRLVALQVDSHLYSDPDAAEVGFKKAAHLIAKVLPPDQFGFPVRDIPADAAMFDSLTPSTGTGQYFQYWPDDNLKRPVYVHMKMIGYKRDRGFHRIVIGNPFRVG